MYICVCVSACVTVRLYCSQILFGIKYFIIVEERDLRDLCVCLQREPESEEQLDPSMPPKFKRHLNDEEVTGSIRSERVSHFLPYRLPGGDDNTEMRGLKMLLAD